MMQWMWLDWIFVAILALSTIFSFFRGFAREALSLISWVLALVLSIFFGSDIGNWLFASFQNATVRGGAGFIFTFFMVLILGMVLNFFIGRFVKMSGLGIFDTILGGAFGFIRGIALLVVIMMFLSMPWLNASELLSESAIATMLQPVVTWAMKYVPSEDKLSSDAKSVLPNIS
jgi:membrane protein required for colicin V production